MCITIWHSSANREFPLLVNSNGVNVDGLGPYLSCPATYKRGPELRKFLLTKLINGERAAMRTPQFHNRQRTRKDLLQDITQKCNTLSKVITVIVLVTF